MAKKMTDEDYEFAMLTVFSLMLTKYPNESKAIILEAASIHGINPTEFIMKQTQDLLDGANRIVLKNLATDGMLQ